MAWEQRGFCVGALKADTAKTSNQFHIVKADTTDNQFALCDTDGERGLGILQDTPAAGSAGDIMLMGISKVVVGVGETLTAGDDYGVDANGEAKKIEATITGADVGDHVLGKVLQGAGAGELAVVTIGLNTYVVEAQ